MRIDGPGRGGPIGQGSGTRRPGSASGFSLPDAGAARRSPVTAAPAGTYDVSALLALQSVEGPLERRRRAVKRGFDLLDTLEDIRLDLLGGSIGADRLERLVGLVGDKAPSEDERIAALIDDIELRARVELAKLGRFPD